MRLSQPLLPDGVATTAAFVLLLPALSAAADCLQSSVNYINYVRGEDPPCCSAKLASVLSPLANRTTRGPSTDSLLSELTKPPSHWGTCTVLSRPRFEERQQIFFQMHVRRLYSVDQKAQQYTLLFDAHWMWRDCRLLYNPDSTGHLEIHQNSPHFSQFWTPTVAFLEEAHSTEVRSNEQYLLIHGDGLVILKQRMSRQLACTFDFTDLPWDQQKCTITAMLPEHTSDAVELHWHPEPLELDPLRNSEWEIAGRDEWLANVDEFLYDAKEPGPTRTVSALRVSFSLTRKVSDICDDYIVTAAVYWFCSYCGFWVDAGAAPARAALALIPILTLTNKMGQLRRLLPPINHNFRLGSFVTAIFILTTLHLLEFAVLHGASVMVARERAAEGDPQSADRQKGTGLVLHRVERLCLRFSKWAKDSLDFHSRWVGIVAFLLTTLLSLIVMW